VFAKLINAVPQETHNNGYFMSSTFAQYVIILLNNLCETK